MIFVSSVVCHDLLTQVLYVMIFIMKCCVSWSSYLRVGIMNSEWDFYLWLEEICLTHSWLDTKQSIDFEVISALLLWSWILLLCHHCKKRLILLCYIKYVCAISHFSPTLWAVGMVSQCMLSSPVVACSFLGLGSTQAPSWAIMKCLGIQVGLCHQFIMKQSFFLYATLHTHCWRDFAVLFAA